MLKKLFRFLFVGKKESSPPTQASYPAMPTTPPTTVLPTKKAKQNTATTTAPEATYFVQPTAPKEGEREPSVIIAAGQKGVGKTFSSINNEIEPTVRQLSRPVLIFDTNNEYKQYAPILPEDIPNFTAPEVRRVVPIVALKQVRKGKKTVYKYRDMTLEEKAEMLMFLLKNFYNGLLVVEDMNNYVTNTRVAGIVSYIVNNRQRGQDILIHVQSLAKIDPTLWENTAIIRLHRQADNLDRYIERVPQKKLVSLAYLYIDEAYKAGYKRDYVYVEMWEVRITGVKHMDIFEKACQTYLELNPSERKRVEATIRTKKQDVVLAHFVKDIKKQFLGG